MWFRKLENSTESYFDEMLGDQNGNEKPGVSTLNVVIIGKEYNNHKIISLDWGTFSLHLKILWVYVPLGYNLINIGV